MRAAPRVGRREGIELRLFDAGKLGARVPNRHTTGTDHARTDYPGTDHAGEPPGTDYPGIDHAGESAGPHVVIVGSGINDAGAEHNAGLDPDVGPATPDPKHHADPVELEHDETTGSELTAAGRTDDSGRPAAGSSASTCADHTGPGCSPASGALRSCRFAQQPQPDPRAVDDRPSDHDDPVRIDGVRAVERSDQDAKCPARRTR